MSRTLFLFAALPLLAASAGGQTEKVKHPRLHAALYELREARAELKASRGEFRGREKEAIAAIDSAITSLKLILAVKSDTSRGLDRDRDYYKKWKDHPRVRSALEDLRDARRELQESKSDFQGNRMRALKDISYAIDQLQALLKADR